MEVEILKELYTDKVYADYMCTKCERRIENVPVQESIYNGPPICRHCADEEMELQTMWLKE